VIPLRSVLRPEGPSPPAARQTATAVRHLATSESVPRPSGVVETATGSPSARLARRRPLLVAPPLFGQPLGTLREGQPLVSLGGGRLKYQPLTRRHRHRHRRRRRAFGCARSCTCTCYVYVKYRGELAENLWPKANSARPPPSLSLSLRDKRGVKVHSHVCTPAGGPTDQPQSEWTICEMRRRGGLCRARCTAAMHAGCNSPPPSLPGQPARGERARTHLSLPISWPLAFASGLARTQRPGGACAVPLPSAAIGRPWPASLHRTPGGERERAQRCGPTATDPGGQGVRAGGGESLSTVGGP
jgi:hypothetical protein